MSWDPALQCVIYRGGGHGGTLDNSVSAYFPESNRWVNSFPAQRMPPVFRNWSDAGGIPAFERGMGCATHCRWYESYAGIMVYGSPAGTFEWSTREQPLTRDTHLLSPDLGPIQGLRALDPTRPVLAGFAWGTSTSDPTQTGTALITDLHTGVERSIRLPEPHPRVRAEWSGMCVHPDRNVLVLHGMGASGTETWLLDLAHPIAWVQVPLARTTPRVGMGKLNAIPGTPHVVCAIPRSPDLWVLDLDRRAWTVLPTKTEWDPSDKSPVRIDLYGPCVWDPVHYVFILMDGTSPNTVLLRPDFRGLAW